MEEPAIHLPPDVISGLRSALLGAAAGCALALCASVAVRVRVRVPSLPPATAASLSALGATLALYGPPAGAEPRAGAAAGRLVGSEGRPPWHRASGFSPPRPLVAGRVARHSAHPALHGRRQPGVAPRPLFPRWNASDARPRTERLPRCTTYVVLPGDTLWDIAAGVLETDDHRRVAAYWPRIHRANPAIISDPNLIHPGQILRLPEERSARLRREPNSVASGDGDVHWRSRKKDECAD